MSSRLSGEPRRADTHLGAVLAAAGAWLLEPAEPALPEGETGLGGTSRSRVVVAVFGLARGCGTTVVARGLAAELAVRDSGGAAAVASEERPPALPLATAPAAALARALADVPGASSRAIGRICVVAGTAPDQLADSTRSLAPLVIDAGSDAIGGAPAALADRSVLVAASGVEPSLAGVAAACLARVGPQPVIVLNRGPATGRWAGRASVVVADSRLGAGLALAGRESRGELGRGIAALADVIRRRS